MNGVVVLPGPTLVEAVISLIAPHTPLKTSSFHNTCPIRLNFDRDGIDWLTLPGSAS